MMIHLIGDVVSSLGVLLSSILVVKYNWVYIDTIVSILICFLIFGSTLPLNIAIFKKLKRAFSVTPAEEQYVVFVVQKVAFFT